MNRDVKDINIEKYLVELFGERFRQWSRFYPTLYIEHLLFLSVIYFHIDIVECRFKGDTPQVLYPVSCIKISILLNSPKIMSANPRYKTILILFLHFKWYCLGICNKTKFWHFLHCLKAHILPPPTSNSFSRPWSILTTRWHMTNKRVWLWSRDCFNIFAVCSDAARCAGLSAIAELLATWYILNLSADITC